MQGGSAMSRACTAEFEGDTNLAFRVLGLGLGSGICGAGRVASWAPSLADPLYA